MYLELLNVRYFPFVLIYDTTVNHINRSFIIELSNLPVRKNKKPRILYLLLLPEKKTN